jgi:hypothetical protein
MITVTRNSITLSAALLLPCTAFYWLWTTPNAIGGSTYIAGSALALATGVIAFNTWRNAQSTGLAQLIHQTDVRPGMSPGVALSRPTTSAPRWDRADQHHGTGRARAFLAFGIMMTGGFLNVWLA